MIVYARYVYINKDLLFLTCETYARTGIPLSNFNLFIQNNFL